MFISQSRSGTKYGCFGNGVQFTTNGLNGWQENGYLKEEKITRNCWTTWNRGGKKVECVNSTCDEDLHVKVGLHERRRYTIQPRTRNFSILQCRLSMNLIRPVVHPRSHQNSKDLDVLFHVLQIDDPKDSAVCVITV